ncbi:MAG TPA: hypothetical protein VN249_13065 [Prolixibacteraceae bacterium]|nr:hypothetical protein [Prolixibacteraceae bacterium]
MMITRDNYEIWFLDYLEGTLDAEHMEMVHQFVAANPDLADGLESCMPGLTADMRPVYPRKELLKRSLFDDPAILEPTAVAAMEGDLTREEQAQFEKWLENKPGAQKLVNNLLLTRLHPDLAVKFPGKARLKRTIVPLSAWIGMVSAAAVLVAAFLIFSPTTKNDRTSSLVKSEPGTTLQQNIPEKPAIAAVKPSGLSAGKTGNGNSPGSPSQVESPSPAELTNRQPEEPVLAEVRSFVPVEMLEPKTAVVSTNIPAFADLILINSPAPVYYASGEIPLSDFLTHKLQALKAGQPQESFSREEFKIAGLRLFSRIPGSHLTGKKGKDGRLKSISFNTQMLAFSIPVNNR